MGFVSRRKEAAEAVREKLAPVASGMAATAEDETLGLLRQSSPSGEVYMDRELGRRYRASAPGEPPARRTGEYERSFGHTEEHMRGDRAVAAMTNDEMVGRNEGKPLWAILEYGTFTQAPRTHIRPAAERTARTIRRATRGEVELRAAA